MTKELETWSQRWQTKTNINSRSVFAWVGEQELRDLCTKFKLSCSDTKHGYCAFKDSRGNIVSSQFRPLLHAVNINTIPVSTAACERGFSVMNDVCSALLCVHYLLYPTYQRWCLLRYCWSAACVLESAASLPYVKAWLAKDWRDAMSLHVWQEQWTSPTWFNDGELLVLLCVKTFSLHCNIE